MSRYAGRVFGQSEVRVSAAALHRVPAETRSEVSQVRFHRLHGKQTGRSELPQNSKKPFLLNVWKVSASLVCFLLGPCHETSVIGSPTRSDVQDVKLLSLFRCDVHVFHPRRNCSSIAKGYKQGEGVAV